MNQLVSVIVPTYNRGRSIAATVLTVLSQSYPYVELVVVDDGSTDGTQRLFETNLCADSRVRYFRLARSGMASARGFGARVARGDVLAFLNVDDLWMPWKLELEVSVLARFPSVGAVFSDLHRLSEQGRLVRSAHTLPCLMGSRRSAGFHPRARISSLMPTLSGIVGDACVWVGSNDPEQTPRTLVYLSTLTIRRPPPCAPSPGESLPPAVGPSPEAAHASHVAFIELATTVRGPYVTGPREGRRDAARLRTHANPVVPMPWVEAPT